MNSQQEPIGLEEERSEYVRQENLFSIQQVKEEVERLKTENINLKSQLEFELVDKIRFISQEEIFLHKLGHQLEMIKKHDQEKKALFNQLNYLENQLNTLTKRYHALSRSKLGRLTLKYWALRKRWIRGS